MATKKAKSRTRRRAASTEAAEVDPVAAERDARIAELQAEGMPWADAAVAAGKEMRAAGKHTDVPLTNPNTIEPVE